MDEISEQDFTQAVLQEAEAGRLALSRLVPATYIGRLTSDMELDHAHLPSGLHIPFRATTDAKSGRADALLLCPTTATELIQAWLSGATAFICLN